MAIIKQQKKEFEKPNAGVVPVTIIDVVDLGWQEVDYGQGKTEVEQIRLLWILGSKDSSGNQFRIYTKLNKNINFNPKTNKKSRLYEIIEQVFGAPPGAEFDDESFIGRSNRAFLVKENGYTNIKGLLPLEPGDVPPTAPAGFVREKDKPGGIRPRPKTPTATPTPVAAAASVGGESNEVSFS